MVSRVHGYLLTLLLVTHRRTFAAVGAPLASVLAAGAISIGIIVLAAVLAILIVVLIHDRRFRRCDKLTLL